jgi:hypothetical protein
MKGEEEEEEVAGDHAHSSIMAYDATPPSLHKGNFSAHLYAQTADKCEIVRCSDIDRNTAKLRNDLQREGWSETRR